MPEATVPHPLAGKRVLFVLCGFDLGGAERQALHLARHLKSLGCDVRVWGHHHSHRGPEQVIEQCEAAGLPWEVVKFRWPCGKKALIRDAWKLLRGLHRVRPDIILPYLPWPCVGCGLVWRLSPATLCVWGQRNTHDLRGDRVERFAYRRVSAVICNAAHEVDFLRATLGQTRAPVQVVHNGVALAPREKTRTEWRTQLGIAPNATVATMLANFRPQKEHPALLHAWRRVQDALPGGHAHSRLVLAGAPQETYSSVRQLAEDLGLGDSVIFPGPVRDIAGLLEASDIGILATQDEGLPNAVLEYMVCGLPVIATDLPGTREALGDDPRQPFCKPADIDGLAGRLTELLRDTALRMKLGALNRQRASTEFSMEKMCDTMTGVLAGLLPARKGVPT